MKQYDLKITIQEKLIGIKNIQIKTPRFDDIRVELEKYEKDNLVETIFDILNDFPEHKCVECGQDTRFISFKNGYKIFCDIKCSNIYKGKDSEINNRISKSVCDFNKSQSDEYWKNRAITHRDTISNETIEYKEYKKQKKSIAMKLIHSERTDEKKKEINNKISISVINSEKAKSQRIRRAKLGAKALNEYRSTMTAEQLKEFNKRFGVKSISECDKEMWKEYYNLVWFYTNTNIKLVKNIELRGVKFGNSLDHMFSIKQGFLDKIAPEIIGSYHNLEIITSIENSSKGAKCSITKEDLHSLFYS